MWLFRPSLGLGRLGSAELLCSGDLRGKWCEQSHPELVFQEHLRDAGLGLLVHKRPTPCWEGGEVTHWAWRADALPSAPCLVLVLSSPLGSEARQPCCERGL